MTITLVPVATDTKWFHPLISSNLICFWKGRIKFLDVNYQPKMPARQSHCLIYLGKNQSRFRQVFSPYGNFNFLEERLFKVGDRFEITTHKKYLGEKGYLSGYHTKDSPEFWVKLDNYDLQIRVFPNQVKFLEDKLLNECTQQSEPLVLCPSCELQHIYLSGRCGMCGLAPENSSEESEHHLLSVNKPKHRQRKGCLYKYIENKKLKSGAIAILEAIQGNYLSYEEIGEQTDTHPNTVKQTLYAP
ncbi:hypothetical protein LC653_44165 [Nostoc sp. CHAB 5784]|uniref:hypothetical protein n=1 Tax=Nostoc mirabile TaxID=2907820 RepID=UPI001E61597C|nr:hypothetical protein [Nostoc mirabile]MCC5670587.1 hypothetical protein [Nostoc mirabile CHAB5784]